MENGSCEKNSLYQNFPLPAFKKNHEKICKPDFVL